MPLPNHRQRLLHPLRTDARALLLAMIFVCSFSCSFSAFFPAQAAAQTPFTDGQPAGSLSRIYIPHIAASANRGVSSGSLTLINEAPLIARSTVSLDENRTCVVYEVFWLSAYAGGEPLRARLTHAIDFVHGTVTVNQATSAPGANSRRCDIGGEPATLRQETTRAACVFDVVVQPGEYVSFACLYQESYDAVYTESLSVTPEPFGRNDRNFNQIEDSLEALSQETGTVEVVLMFTAMPPDAAARLAAVGGSVRTALSEIDVLLASVPAIRVAELRASLGDDLMLIGLDAALPTPYMVPRAVVDGTNAAAGEGTPWLDESNRRDLLQGDRLAVAVLDTGADVTHPALSDRIRTRYSAVNKSPDVADVDGQGTHVAAVIGGKSLSGGFEGVAGNVDLIPVQAGSERDWQLGNILTAINWIVQERQAEQIVAINNSLSLAGQSNPFWSVAMRRAAEAGLVVVNAAGDIGGVHLVGAPAAEPLVLTVGAGRSDGTPLDYSSYSGPTAPVAKPDLLAQGNDILAARSAQVPGGQGESDYVLRSGTEVAAPIVTGGALHVIDALVDITGQDLDEDNRTDEDPWNGLDDDGDDLIDEDLAGWWDNKGLSPVEQVKRVKSLLMMTANPLSPDAQSDLGRLASGSGLIHISAAQEAVDSELCGVDGGTFNAAHPAASSWARHIHLLAGEEYSLHLNAPEGTDFDLFLYRSLPDSDGSPVIARRPGPQTDPAGYPIQDLSNANNKTLTFSVRQDGLYYVVVKRAEGAGSFTVTLDDRKRAWTIMLYMAGELPGDAALDDAINAALNNLDMIGSGQGATRAVQVVALVDYENATWDRHNLLTSAAAQSGDAVIYCIRKDYKDGALRYTVPVSIRHAFGTADSEVNMGDPATLAEFVSWAGARFPAERQALILFGDRTGHGWKTNEALAVGPGHDTDSESDSATEASNPEYDALTLAELRSALAAALDDGDKTTPSKRLAFLGFDMGQTATVEIAAELSQVADVLIVPAGRQAEDSQWPYAAMLEALRCGATCDSVERLSSETLAERIVAAAQDGGSARLTALRLAEPKEAVECGSIATLTSCLSSLGEELTDLLNDLGNLSDPADNGQMMIHALRADLPEGHDRNFVDLAALVERISADPKLDAAVPSARRIAAALIPGKERLVIAKGAGEGVAGGLMLYFPTRAVASPAACPQPEEPPGSTSSDCGFDHPYPAAALYATPDSMAITESVTDTAHFTSTAPIYMDLQFVRQNKWDEFLQRYYQPVPAPCVLGEDGSCTRSLVIAQGESVTITAEGSSDADLTEAGELAYYWDTDLTADVPAPLPDYTATPETLCSEDCDRDGHDGVNDDPDVVGPTMSWSCSEPASSVRVRLMVHDDRHTLTPRADRADYRRWHAASAELTIYCAVPPQANNDDSLLTHGSTSTTQYRFVLVGNPDLASGEQGRLINPIPAGLRVKPADIEASDGQVTTTVAADGSVTQIEWRGTLDQRLSKTLIYQAQVDATQRPPDQPYVVNQARFYDGVVTRTLAITTPAVALSVTPVQVHAGEWLTYTAVIPGPADIQEETPFGVQYSRAGNPLEGGSFSTHPPSKNGPIELDEAGGFWLWSGIVMPDGLLTFKFTMQVREELEPDRCGPFADSFAYAYEAVGLIPFDGPTYQIVCPPEEGLR